MSGVDGIDGLMLLLAGGLGLLVGVWATLAFRWSERWQEYRELDHRLGGPHPPRWQIGGGERLELHAVDELPDALTVDAGGRALRVVPLPQLVHIDGDVAAVAGTLCRPASVA